MIISAAVKILLKKENREVIIPCHRHGDAYRILKDLGFTRISEKESFGFNLFR